MSFPETKFGQVLEVLSRGEIRFVVVGGLAAIAHMGTLVLPTMWTSSIRGSAKTFEGWLK